MEKRPLPRSLFLSQLTVLFMNKLQDFEYLKFQNNKENLHDVFGTVLDIFPHVTGATVTGQVYLWDALQKIKYNLAYDIAPDTYLLNKYVNGKRNTAYDERKKQLPAICYNARFNGYKNIDHIKSITNLMFLDIDDFPTREAALDYKDLIIKKYDWIIACNLSLSKSGLHIIALVDIIHGNKDYNEKYDFISNTYFDSRLDKSSKSLTRYTVLPFDYDIYINENPSVLNIDEIINEYRKGIRSAYMLNDVFTGISLNDKGISSAYNISDNHLNSFNNEKEKGICSVYNPPYPPEKIICTPYTFSSDSSLELIVNDAARLHKLRFRMEVDESHFKDPNIPIYIREGVDVIDVNLFPLRGRKIYEGCRNKFIGALTVKMLYLNAGCQEINNTDIRKDILKFILHINKTICEPPMTFDEVIKSYNANWRRYKKGEIDFSKYFKKQRAFWSKHSTLTANEKRSVTCKIKNAPTVENSKRGIWEAMEQLAANQEKITQKRVAEISGIKYPTVKKYRKEYSEYKKMLIGDIDIFEIDGNITSIPNELHVNTPNENLTSADNTNHNLADDDFELFDIDVNDFEDDRAAHLITSERHVSTPNYTEDQLHLTYQRIFNSLLKTHDENYSKKLYESFLDCFSHLPYDEAKLLITPIENVSDNDFWKHFNLENKIKTQCIEANNIMYN
jgi:hypothetical protein